MKKVINTLVMSGGGLKGIAYIGVFKFLDELKQNPEYTIDIKEICSVSIGTITSLLYILGYTCQEFYNEIINKDLHDLRNIKLRTFLSKYGLDTGKTIIKWVSDLIVKKGFSKDLTFNELFTLTGVNYRIVSCNLNKYKNEIFDYKNSPNLKVLKAIRMAISIPLVFSIEKYNDDIYVDGAIINNFPIDIYSENLENVLGIKLSSGDRDLEQKHETIDTFDSYIFHVMS